VKIRVRVFFREDAAAALRRDPELTRLHALGAGAFASSYIESRLGDALFDRVIEATRGTSGIEVQPLVEFAGAEVDSVQHFQPRARKVLWESSRDGMLTRKIIGQTQAVGPGLAKLLDRVYLSKIKLAANVIAGYADWTDEYVTAVAVTEHFRRRELTGLSQYAVVNAETDRPFDGYVLMQSHQVLPPALADASTSPRLMGCLTYKVAPKTDFSRTREPWAGNGLPTWVVSKTVVECVREDAIRGWSFVPVLAAEGALYSEYRHQFAELKRALEVNAENRFR
jgi:hypothetical protein